MSDDQFEQEMQPTASPRGSIKEIDHADELRVKSDPEKPSNEKVDQGPGLPNNLEFETRQIVASDCP
jgi:hypothetical protein